MKNQQNFIYFNTNLTTNFKPKNSLNSSSFQFFERTNQIFCKNFLSYILLIKYQNHIFSKSSLFIKKYKKKIYTILRSPYRHKLARHQIHLNRYNVKSSLKIKIITLKLKNWKNLLKYVKFLKNLNKIFESNLIFVNNVKISIPFSFKNNFEIKKFIN